MSAKQRLVQLTNQLDEQEQRAFEKLKTKCDKFCQKQWESSWRGFRETGPEKKRLQSQAEARWSEVKKFLWTYVAQGHCLYCERPTDSTSRQLDHYRPKNRPTSSNLEGAGIQPRELADHEGYYWLILDLQNFIPACNECNQKKRNSFPIIGDPIFDHKTGRELSLKDLQRVERPLLLHPLHDVMHEHFHAEVGPIVGLLPKTERGNWTYELLGLDRENLSQERNEILLDVDNECKRALLCLTRENCLSSEGFLTEMRNRLRQKWWNGRFPTTVQLVVQHYFFAAFKDQEVFSFE